MILTAVEFFWTFCPPAPPARKTSILMSSGLIVTSTPSSTYDNRNAIIALHSGAGGVESQDWASMLMRMYLRWAERRGFKTEVLDVSVGEEAGIKSAVIQITGDHAYGYTKAERGVHRLVRLSPFDGDHARHTSFALLEVLPEVEEGVDVTINPDAFFSRPPFSCPFLGFGPKSALQERS